MITEVVCSAVLAAVFLASSIPKLLNAKGFVVTVLIYQIVPSYIGRIYARMLPSVEFLCALLLLTGTAVRLAALLIALMLLSFEIAVSINLSRGRILDCQCFGARRGRRIGWRVLIEDGCLLVMSLFLLVASRNWINIAPWSVFHLVAWVAHSFFPEEASALVHAVPYFSAILICILATLCVAVALGKWRRLASKRLQRV